MNKKEGKILLERTLPWSIYTDITIRGDFVAIHSTDLDSETCLLMNWRTSESVFVNFCDESVSQYKTCSFFKMKFNAISYRVNLSRY